MIHAVTSCRSYMRSPVVVLSLALIAGLSGCGGGDAADAGSPRVNASGEVTFAGKAIPAGTVTFLNPATGNLAVCPISNGVYSSQRGQGPNPGKNTVMIVGQDKVDGTYLWSGSWSTEVEVDDESDYDGEFTVNADEVKPFDGKVLMDDD